MKAGRKLIGQRGSGTRGGWLLGLFLILLLAVLDASLFLIYRQVRGVIEVELGNRLEAIAAGAAAAVAPERMCGLTADPAGRDAEVLAALLERIRSETRAGDIFVFDADHRHLLDAGRRFPVGYPNPALELHYGAATAALTGISASSELYRVGEIYLKTSFAPILDEQGVVLGAVGVEGGSDFFRGFWALRRQLLVSGALGMAAILAVTVLFARSLRAQAAAERTLRETSALTAAGELAAILAHEIRNPLAIISARAERVRAKIERGRPAEEILEWFDAIPREVERLNRVLTQYLSFARPADLEGDSADLGATIDTALALLEGDFARKGIAIERPAAAAERVALAPAALHQVLLNLLLNARDALAGGGRVAIEVEPAPAGIWVSMSDTGAGMSPETQRRAFERFFTTKEHGSGLGLAVVRSMLDLYGGRVTFESQEGRGTTFRLWLPRARAEAASGAVRREKGEGER